MKNRKGYWSNGKGVGYMYKFTENWIIQWVIQFSPLVQYVYAVHVGSHILTLYDVDVSPGRGGLSLSQWVNPSIFIIQTLDIAIS